MFIRLFVKEGWTNRETGKKGDPRIQFNMFKQLQDVLPDLSKKISIQLDIDQLNENTIDYLDQLTTAQVGDKHINFIVYELKDKIKLQMPSRSRKVSINRELLDSLKAKDMHFKVQ